MAANWELQLISSILMDTTSPAEKFRAARDFGIAKDMFTGFEAALLWSKMVAYHDRSHNYGNVPSVATIKEEFPHIELPTPLENFRDLCDKLKNAHVARLIEKEIMEYEERRTPGNVLECAANLAKKVNEIQEQLTAPEDVVFGEKEYLQFISDFSKAPTSETGLSGIPWPWAPLNEATMGIQNTDYIMLWALPKNLKTWVALVVTAYVLSTGRSALVYSKEMNWVQIRNRIIAIMAEIDYHKMLNPALLTTGERLRLFDAADFLKEQDRMGKLVFSTLDRMDGSPGGPAEIRRKVDVYKPDFIMLDSCYMLELPGVNDASALDWKALSAVNRRIKQICKTCKVPILGIFQESERAAFKYLKSRGTASMAMNSGATMDCDVGIRIVAHKKKKELSLHLPVARETDKEGFTIYGVPASNFKYAHNKLYTITDVNEDAEKEDTANRPAGARQQEEQRPHVSLVERVRAQTRVPDEVEEDLDE